MENVEQSRGRYCMALQQGECRSQEEDVDGVLMG